MTDTQNNGAVTLEGYLVRRWRRTSFRRLDGSIELIDCVKALADSSLDLAVYPGEKVFVPRRF